MTEWYERLKGGPCVKIHRNKLTPEERQELRQISVTGATGRSNANTPGTYTTVYYLEGDEREAVERFIEENRELIEQIDLSKQQNALQQSLAREIYDLILHELELRERTKYETVVLEERPDGTQWVIDREKYERYPNRRYTVGESGSAKVPPDTSLRELYEGFEGEITETDLKSTPIEGDVRQVLDYYRLAGAFACLPTTTSDSKLAVSKS